MFDSLDTIDKDNDYVSDSSSQGSEFFDATQFQPEDNVPVKYVTQNQSQGNMDFLKESWANMVEEEDRHRIRDDMDKDQENSNYTVATPKANKKKKSYATRSKVGPSRKAQ